MSALSTLLEQFEKATLSQRDKGTSFENLIIKFFQFEPYYKSQYSNVQTYAQWIEEHGASLGLENKTDAGIDLVLTSNTGEFHAVQCKNYSADYSIQKNDIDSFFTASGKQWFTHRYIVTTTNKWSKNAREALTNQQIPVSVINLEDLENSQIDWSQFQIKDKPVLKAKKGLRPHQQSALKHVETRFNGGETRGKLIMACGTGKTFTALKIAEKMAGKGKRVLFLVPSLSLLSQTLREWNQDTETPLINFAVCSDSDVGKKHNEDSVLANLSDLQFPATTNAKSLANAVHVVEQKNKQQTMTVVYSTYHSIDVIHQAQSQHNLPEFDLIICDEAHRTTGATWEGDSESAFVRVHDANYIKGAKRLYMTATPRIYVDDAKAEDGVSIYSMDDETFYGKDFFVLTFSQAVSQELLVDYKVIVLAVDQAHVERRLQELLRDDTNSELKIDDAAKIVGCWKALSKYGLSGEEGALYNPMRRAVAFCQVIEKNYKGNKHKVSSKLIADEFSKVVKKYQQTEKEEWLKNNPDLLPPPSLAMICEAEHVDGGMNAGEKESKLRWLKAPEGLPEDTCRILSNVRCLSEGVDVPSLDAVLFLTPRNSKVDVVQSVGRVMRRAEGKKQGYVILPVVIPPGIEPEIALDKNENFKVVWEVLNALRSHDDRFDAMINQLELEEKNTNKLEIISITGHSPKQMEVVSKVEKVAPKAKRNKQEQVLSKAKNSFNIGQTEQKYPIQETLPFETGAIERALYAKIVKKCGNRHHWEDWADDIAKIARTHIDSINAILENPANETERTAFEAFAAELRDDLNNAVSDEEIVEMLAQHMITKPVFDALFSDYSFAEHNPMSRAMQKVLDLLQQKNLHKERNTLQSFYDSVHLRASGIETAEGKQKIVVELYDKFFRNAFPRMTERLGIVYTPVEVVDFIIKSVEDVLQHEFKSSLQDKDVHILDPFTGTGTFITRLLQSGIIPRDRLPEKYKSEIHANEIVLLAYYIAAINIESAYHGILAGNIDGNVSDDVPYVPFEGICLTDTFQMYEKGDMLDEMLVDNSARRKRQKALDIRVIIGNPPYSAGQESANDNNANIEYPHLDARIRETYAEHSAATNKNALYDSYIRAIRWASDRIGQQGVIGFVTNAGWVEANTADGLRKCLAEEFSSLYIFHLRGNQRTSGERSRKEGGKIFGSGSRAPIAISILVKNPQVEKQGQIYFHDIGDYLTREQKLETIAELGSINGITERQGWREIVPDKFNDWLNQRDPNFDNYISLGDKKNKDTLVVFENYSNGIKTNRDAWCYNFSDGLLRQNMQNMISFYNNEVARFQEACKGLPENRKPEIDTFINYDDAKISWNRSLKNDFAKQKIHKFEEPSMRIGLYRPFTKSPVYFNRQFNDMVYQIPMLYPNLQADNQVISVTGRGSTKEFSALISSEIPDLEMISKGQCFPLNVYEFSDGVEIAERTNERTNERNYTPRSTVQYRHLPHHDRRQGLLCAYHRPNPRFTPYRRRTVLPDVSLRDGVSNMTICITGLATTKGFSVLMTDAIPDVQLQMNGQCFPMFLYETEEA